MCGILGSIGFNVILDSFKQSLDLIAHRGPDGYGVFTDDDALVNLGHRRLAIIDTDSRSNQPMTFVDRYTIVYNGEIYNYREIRNYLISKGCNFVTESDTEVLLKLLITEGPGSLNKCNGMWSFALYDKVTRTLLLGRDRLGKKPLYFYQAGGKFAFCSEMKGLYPYLNDFSYNLDYLSNATEHPNFVESRSDCLIEGIEKFPAGCFGYFVDGKLSMERYYDPQKLLEKKSTKLDFYEAVEKFQFLINDSCKLRMRSDVPVGTALSGGIDSSLIASTIANLGFKNSDFYKVFIASFPGSILDETSDALTVASNADLNYETVIINPKLSGDAILWSTYQFEEIGATAPIPFNQTYQAFRNSGVVVTLDGHGADELFGGYTMDIYAKLDDDFPNPWKMQKSLQLLNEMYGFAPNYPMKDIWPVYKSKLKKLLKSKNIDLISSNDAYRNKLYQSTFSGILPTLLRNYDRYSMQAGVEIRMPFLDYRIVEFAFELNTDMKIRNGYSKAIVREAAKRIVPNKILRNKVKTGWNSPMGEWLKTDLKEWYLDELASKDFINCSLMDSVTYKERAMRYINSSVNNQNEAQDLWLKFQPYLIDKANCKFAQIKVIG
jgi:asparagine synthase (glutamine-hydrolysing)